MGKKGIFLKEEVGFKPETPAARKVVKTKAAIKSAKRVEPKIKK